jgi:long-chain acyl-CoA synthetase
MAADLSQRFAHLASNDTLPKLVRHNARHYGAEVAMREKHFGRWRSFTFAEVEARAQLWALGLSTLGVGHGDVVAIIGDSRPDWIAAAVGVHALGAMSLGLYQDAMETEVGYLIRFAAAKVIIAEDEEQVDKMLRAGADAATLAKIVYLEPRGMRKYTDPRVISADAVFDAARAIAAADSQRWTALVDATRGEDIAVLCSTSGTTSNPKLVAITSGRFIPHVATYCDLMAIGPRDEYVSMLPMGWIGEQFEAFYQPIIARHTVNFVESAETAMADMREIAPTFILLAPRVWEQIAANVHAQVMDASPAKRRLFQWGQKLGLRAVEAGRTSKLAQVLVLRALRDRLGFSRLRLASTGGAAMGPDTFKFFMSMGVPMVQLYGQTELGGIYCTQVPGAVDFDAVGTGLSPQYAIRIDQPDQSGVGEIVSQHPYMFSGYYKNEEATAAEVREGWMHTGDAGYFKPGGQLVVIDRVRDLAALTTGERFSPQFIENKLKFSPFISEAVILGDQRAWPAAIVCIRFAIVSKWAEQQRMSFTTYSDLASRPEVIGLIAGEVARVNATLPAAQRLRKLVLLYKELDADDGELTRTRKVRRGVIAEKYADIIEAIYTDATQVKIDTEITFQDGTRQRIRTTLPVMTLETAATTTTAKAG